MKLPKVVETMLNDKNVLYIVAFLAIMNFFGYIILRDSYALLIFLSVGFISTYFSKNMTIVLLSTLLLTNFITVLSRNFVVNKEGFDATADTTDAAATADSSAATADATKDITATKGAKKPVAAATASTATGAKPVAATGSGVMGAGTAKASKKVAATKTAEGMTDLSPASLDDEDDLPVNNRVDYAKTLEKTYDNLERKVSVYFD